MIKTPFSVLLALLLALPQLVYSQYSETIASGRPGNANGPFSVGKGVYQVQFGQNFIQSTNSASSNYKGFLPEERIISGPDVLFRIGIKEDFELRIGAAYTFSEKVNYTPSEFNEQFSGLNTFVIGVRQNLFAQKGILPATAIQFTTNFGGVNEYKKELPDASFRLNLANKIGEKLNLNWNFISRWEPDNSSITGFYIFSFSYPILKDLTISAEVFGNIDETTKLNGGIGLSYILNSNFQIDAYGSYGKNEIERGNITQELFTMNAGISYRIVKRDK